jgi:hypothetical protein
MERGRALAHLGEEELFTIWAARFAAGFTIVRRRTNAIWTMQPQRSDFVAFMPEDRLDSLLEEIKIQYRVDPRGPNEKTRQQILDFLAGRKRPH